jgi:hypothetical protein
VNKEEEGEEKGAKKDGKERRAKKVSKERGKKKGGQIKVSRGKESKEKRAKGAARR